MKRPISRKKSKENLSGNTSYQSQQQLPMVSKGAGSRNSSNKSKKAAGQAASNKPEVSSGLQKIITQTVSNNQSKFEEFLKGLNKSANLDPYYQPEAARPTSKSRQSPLLASIQTDLYQTQAQRQEIADLMKGMIMPDDDESLTVSSALSQSPFAVVSSGTQRNPLPSKPPGMIIADVLRNQYEQHNSTENELTTLGRSDEDNRVATGTLRQWMAKSGAGGTGTMKRAIRRINQGTASEDEEEDEEEEEGEGLKEDSPDFNRRKEGESNYDLTVSQSAIFSNQATPLSYRQDHTQQNNGVMFNQSKLGGGGNSSNSNRSFADNVLNHQQYTSSSQNNTHRAPDTSRQQKRLGTHRRRDFEEGEVASPRIAEYSDSPTSSEDIARSSNNFQQQRLIKEEASSQEEEEEDVRGRNMDASEMSAIDSFAQTQYSKQHFGNNSNLAVSRYVKRRDNTPSSMTAMTPGGTTSNDKSPHPLRKMDAPPGTTTSGNHEESMSLTPSTYNEKGGRQWALTQKSYLTANTNNMSQIGAGPLNILSRVQNEGDIILPGGDNISTHTGGPNRTASSENSSNLLNKLTHQFGHPQTTTNRTTTLENGVVRGSRNGALGSRDQELESALETAGGDHFLLRNLANDNRGGAYSTLKQATTLEDSKEDGSPNEIASSTKLRLSQLELELKRTKAQNQQYAHELEARDNLVGQLEQRNLELESFLRDKSEHLDLLKLKFKDQEENLLPRLRQKNLENAMRRLNQLEKENLKHAQEVARLEGELRMREQDDEVVHQLEREEIKRLIAKVDTLEALTRGKDREAKQAQADFQLRLDKLKQEYEHKGRECAAQLDEARRKLADQVKVTKRVEAQLQSSMGECEAMKHDLSTLSSQLQDKDKQQSKLQQQIAQEREKGAQELRHYKERCKTLEGELEQLRQFESSSMMLLRNKQGANDFELKQVKEVYDRKLHKLNEEVAKKGGAIRDLESEITKLRATASQHSGFNTQMVERLQRENAALSGEVSNAKEQLVERQEELAAQRQLAADIRYYFGLSPQEDLIQTLAKASQSMLQVPLLEAEVKRLLTRVEELQRSLVEQQVNSSTASMQSTTAAAQLKQSDFFIKLMAEKDRQCKDLQRRLEELKEHSMNQDIQVTRLATELAAQRTQCLDVRQQLECLGREKASWQECRLQQESQLEDLKERLRSLHRENIGLQGQVAALKEDLLAQAQVRAGDRAKYEALRSELASRMDGGELIQDDMQMVSTLFEKQAQLIAISSEKLDHLRQETSALQSKLSEVQSNLLEREQSLEQKESLVTSLNLQLDTQAHAIERGKAELDTVTLQCERTMSQLREVEAHNIRLRGGIEQANANLRKALRAQESVKSALQPAPKKGVQQLISHALSERESMSYEEQLTRSYLNGENRGKELALQTLKSLMLSSEEDCIQPGGDAFTLELQQLYALVRRHSANQAHPRMSQIVKGLSHIKKNFDDDSCFLLDEVEGVTSSQLADLEAQHRQQVQVLNEQLGSLELVANEKEIQLAQVSGQLVQSERNVKALADELRHRERLSKEQEVALQQKLMEIEEQARARERVLSERFERERSKIEGEYASRCQGLEAAQRHELARLRDTVQAESAAVRKELEQRFAQRQQELEEEFICKLQKAEGDMAKMSEQTKEATVSQLYKRFHQEKEGALTSLRGEHEQALLSLRQEHATRVGDLQKELKRAREGVSERLKKAEAEWLSEKEGVEREHAQKLESLNTKHKTALRAAQDKAKSEGRNQLDQVKNELARARAEFEREKKKISQDHASQVGTLQQELADVKIAKDKGERVAKKKLEELEKERGNQITQLETQLKSEKSNHQVELGKAKERVEAQLREIVKAEIKNEVIEELELEYKAEISRLIEKHRLEMEKLRQRQQEQIERVEKASQLPVVRQTRDFSQQCEMPLPKPVAVINRFDLMQDSPVDRKSNRVARHQHFEEDYNNEADNTGLVVINQSSIYSPSDDIIEYARNPPPQASERVIELEKLRREHEVYVGQLRANYEEELERQQLVFEQQLVGRQCQTARVFEELMTLELDKILQSIYLRNDSCRLDHRRREINTLVSDILLRTDDQDSNQLKSSLDSLKRKVSEVLTAFKQELESRFQRKLDTAIRESTQTQQVRDSMQIPLGLNQMQYNDAAAEKPQQNNLNMPRSFEDRRRVETEQSMASGGGELQQSPIQESTLPTHQSKFSEVKNYVTLETNFGEGGGHTHILRRIAPAVNSKGLLTVEVSKVLKDLEMLYKTIKQAKFFKMITEGGQRVAAADLTNGGENLEDHDAQQRGSQRLEESLDQYRNLLNNLIRLVVTLNQCTDQLTKSQEVYRVKLVNADLRESLSKLQRQVDHKDISMLADQILSYYSASNSYQKRLNQDGMTCIQQIENCIFSINKQHFKLFQLKDLFIASDESRRIEFNQNIQEVNRACSEYVRTHSLDANDPLLKASQLQASIGQDTLTQSQQYSPEKLKLAPEMLSREDLALLLGSIFAKMSGPAQNQEFFQVYLSNDENIRNAEAFIKKYRENIHSMTGIQHMPLQVATQRSHDTQMFSKHINLLSENTILSKHQRGRPNQIWIDGESRQGSNPRNQTQTYGLMNTAVTNVFSQHSSQPGTTREGAALLLKQTASQKSFQSNMPLQMPQHFQSIASHPMYHQQHTTTGMMSTTTAPTTVSKANHPYQSIQLKASSSANQSKQQVAQAASTGSLFNNNNMQSVVDEAQHTVNHLFENMQRKSREQYNASAPMVTAKQMGMHHPQFFFSK